VPVALGSDTGGSIRQPAGWCGIVGLKPTYGRVSRYGLIAFASSLDQIGPLGASPACVAACLHAIAGHDPLDSTSAHMPTEDFGRDLLTGHDRKALRHGAEALRAIKIGVPDFATAPGNSPGVQAAMVQAMDRVRAMGGQIVPIELPHAHSAIAAYYIIAPAEASSNLARFDGVRYGRRAELGPGDELMDLYCRSRSEGFGAEVQRRIMLGTHVLSSGYIDAYYLQALKVRRLIKQDYDHAFASGVSAVLTPSSPGPAFRLGEKLGDPLSMYLEDVYTVAVNLAGLPGITVPGGIEHVDGQALPIGLQLVGPSLSEASLLALADRLGTHQ